MTEHSPYSLNEQIKMPPTPTPMAQYKAHTGETLFLGMAGKWIVELSARGECCPETVRLVHSETGVVLVSYIPHSVTLTTTDKHGKIVSSQTVNYDGHGVYSRDLTAEEVNRGVATVFPEGDHD